MPEPIKRHEALQPLSRDHHDGLLLCFKIRQGLKKEVEPQRIWAYIRHFYNHHLEEHFRDEERYLFPFLESDREGVQRALEDHSQIERMLSQSASRERCEKLEQILKAHIRFEERVLFNEFQDSLKDNQLWEIHSWLHTPQKSCDLSWEDKFWE